MTTPVRAGEHPHKTTTPQTPCQANNAVSREYIDRVSRNTEIALERVPESDVPRRKLIAADLRRLRALSHPDDWFIDPGSGRDTVDGKRRRRAIQACWADCPMRARLKCLDEGMQGPENSPTLSYGVYGGYTEKQRQAVFVEIQSRNARRAALDT